MSEAVYAVWYASAGCLPDSETPEYVGSLEACESYVLDARFDDYCRACDAHNEPQMYLEEWLAHGEPDGPGREHDLYGYSIDPWEDDDEQ